MMTEKQLEERYPWIKWREPIEVSLMDGSQRRLACRFCIGQIGLKGSEMRPFSDEREFNRHLLNDHGLAPL